MRKLSLTRELEVRRRGEVEEARAKEKVYRSRPTIGGSLLEHDYSPENDYPNMLTTSILLYFRFFLLILYLRGVIGLPPS